MYFTARICLLSRNPRFLVGRLLAAPITKLLELYLSLNLLLVPVCIIIPPLADGAPHRYQIVGPFHFRHGRNNSSYEPEKQPMNGARLCTLRIRHRVQGKREYLVPGLKDGGQIHERSPARRVVVRNIRGSRNCHIQAYAAAAQRDRLL